MRAPEAMSTPVGEKLTEKLRGMDIARERIRLDGLRPPEMKSEPVEELSVEDARKLLRLAQLERVKSRLRDVPKSWLPYSEYVDICVEGCSDPSQGLRFARMLDDSGTVIVLGDIVFLHPEQVNFFFFFFLLLFSMNSVSIYMCLHLGKGVQFRRICFLYFFLFFSFFSMAPPKTDMFLLCFMCFFHRKVNPCFSKKELKGFKFERALKKEKSKNEMEKF